MKAVFLFCSGIILSISVAAQVGINATGSTPHVSAGLDVDFTDLGFLPPRMTTSERDAIASPADGLIIYNTTTGCVNVRSSGVWKQVCPECDFPNPVVTSSGPLCEGENLQLSASTIPDATYYWQGPNGFSSTEQNPQVLNIPASGGGFYSVTATVNGCTGSPQSIYVSVQEAPSNLVAGNDGLVCAGSNAQLSASGPENVTYTWSGPGGFSSSDQNPLISNAQVASSGLYTVVATSIEGGCSSDPATTTLSVQALPTITGSTPGSRVGAGTVELGATASSGSVNWFAASSGGSSLAQGTTFTTPAICATTTYYAEASDNGCPSSARTAVTATLTKVFQVDNGCTLTNGLISYWRMEGNSADYVGSNAGSDVSMTYNGGSGKVGQGGAFNGSSSRITVTENTSLALPELTLSMWIKTTASSGFYMVIARRSATFFQGYGLNLNPSTGYLRGFIGTGSDNEILSTKVVNDGNWHLIALTWSNTTKTGQLYCDNTLLGTINLGQNLLNSGALSIGYDVPNGGYNFNGSIDQAGVWSRVLTTQELTDLYNSGLGQTMQ